MAHGMSDSPPSRFLQITFRKRCRIRWQSWFKVNGWELPWIKHGEVERIVKRKHTWLKCFVAYSAFHSSTTSGCHSILMPREKLGDGLQFHEASTVFRVWQSYQTTWWDWDWPKIWLPAISAPAKNVQFHGLPAEDRLKAVKLST